MCYVSGYLAIWLSGYLAICLSGYLAIWLSGYLAIWLSGPTLLCSLTDCIMIAAPPNLQPQEGQEAGVFLHVSYHNFFNNA